LGADGAIYGIPACALRVVRIDPTTNSSEFIGTPRRGSWKWGQGCLAPNGVIYASPCNEHTVLCIDTNLENQLKKTTVTMLEVPHQIVADGSDSANYSTASKWWGAVYVPPITSSSKPASIKEESEEGNDGVPPPPPPPPVSSPVISSKGDFVYFTPKNMRRVLKLNIHTREMALVGDSLMIGGEKYLGACYHNGYVVCSPANRGGRKVMLFDPLKETTTLVGPDLGGAHFKWHDSVVGMDGRIYGLPHHADKAIVIDLKLAGASIAAAAKAKAEPSQGLSSAGSFSNTAASIIRSTSGNDSSGAENPENNGIVDVFGPSLGADGGRYGCGVLGDDGYICKFDSAISFCVFT
jgi:hypothetical protein